EYVVLAVCDRTMISIPAWQNVAPTNRQPGLYTKHEHNFLFFNLKDVGWISVAHPPFRPYLVDALALICPLQNAFLNFDRLCPF
ncbi:MAG: hypothetical protein ACRER2_02395, partial [Methylococcales bacterium]